jgi:hypothetical protein
MPKVEFTDGLRGSAKRVGVLSTVDGAEVKTAFAGGTKVARNALLLRRKNFKNIQGIGGLT